MAETTRIRLPGRMESVPAFARFVAEACAQHGADADTAYALRFAVEELGTNTIKYGYAGMEPGDIALDFTAHPDRFVIAMTDWGRPYDPREAPAPDLTLSAEERPIGGLGVYLVRSMIDELAYRPDSGHGNVLTLVKRRDGQGSTKKRNT